MSMHQIGRKLPHTESPFLHKHLGSSHSLSLHSKRSSKKSNMNNLCRLISIMMPFVLTGMVCFHYTTLRGSFSRKQALHASDAMRVEDNFPVFRTSSTGLKTVADVPGANMDHNGSISNPCITKLSLAKIALFEPSIQSFSPVGTHSFILRSSYRVAPQTFVVLGLSALQLHEKKEETEPQCNWLGSDGESIFGKVFFLWPGEHHGLMYETVIFRCELLTAPPPHSKGSLLMEIDDEMVVIYKEFHNVGNQFVNPNPIKYKISVCSFPLYRDVNPPRVREWIQYMHHNLAVDYFLLNDGGSVTKAMVKELSDFISAGVVEVNDIRAQFKYESKHNVLTLNDCLYQMRFKSEWLLFLDFDEYLQVDAPNTLPSLLEKHKDTPFVTFGSLWWSVNLCRSPLKTGEFPIEKMTFHWPTTYCVGYERGYTTDMCLNYFGHRKYIVNPRKVWTVEVHRPKEPIDGGVNLNTSIARINHFQGLLRSTLNICDQLVTKMPDWWLEDDYIAVQATRAREAGGPRVKHKLSLSTLLTLFE